MPNYRYQCIDKQGKLIRDKTFALNDEDLENRLNSREMTLITAKAIMRTPLLELLTPSRVKPRILTEFYHRLSQTLELGLPLLGALEENARLLPCKTLKKVAAEIQVSIESGGTLHESMARFPKIFKKLDLSIIKMGEQSGILPESIKNLSEFLEWKEDIHATLKRAMIYPCFVILVITAVVGVWVGYVLPQMAKVLAGMGIQLPMMTRAVLGFSGFLNNNWLLILTLMVISALCLYLYQRSPKGGIVVHKYFLKLPLVGTIASNIAVARLSHNFATMYNSGITISYIFDILSNDILGNRFLQERLRAAYKEILRGDSIAQGFEKAGGFPPLLVGAIRNGETTGTIDKTFKRLGDYYDGEVKRAVQAMISVIEPATIILLGMVFGIIVLSIMLPLYDVLQEFK